MDYLRLDKPGNERTTSLGPLPKGKLEPKISIQAADKLEHLEDAVRDGTCDLGVHILELKPLRLAGENYFLLDCKCLTLENSTPSSKMLRYFEERLARANARSLEAVLRAVGDPASVRTEHVVLKEKHPEERPSFGTISMAALVPLILILMTITGAVYPAIDLTAGERERGTLEILVAAPIPRMGLLLAKYVSVLTVAVLTALVNLVMMTGTLLVTGLGPILFGEERLSALLVVEVFGLLLLFATFFSAVLLTLTSFARSFKEAQSYLVPLMLVSLAPGIIGMLPGLELSGLLSVTPLLNIVLLARDLFEGRAVPWAFVVVLSTFLYALAALAGAARIFGGEGVLYSEQTNWSDLFRRPAQPQSAATVTSALFCVALLFPLYFIAHFTVGRVEDLELRMGLTSLAAVFLFVVWPLLWGAFGRVQPLPGFQADRAAWRTYPGAILLGLCLWPFAAELTVLLREVGVQTLGPEHLAQVQEELQKWRQFSPAVIVLVYAVVPAVCEEFFFRGHLFSALRARIGPLGTVGVTAFLFGFFHLISGVERFAPTALLGLVLGWICWRSRSIFPGIIVHACHNGFLVWLAYSQEESEAASVQLPWQLMAGAAAGVALGSALVLLTTRPERQGD
jgi:ABC-2 type transport system permease protein/sodium transport system permease protein